MITDHRPAKQAHDVFVTPVNNHRYRPLFNDNHPRPEKGAARNREISHRWGERQPCTEPAFHYLPVSGNNVYQVIGGEGSGMVQDGDIAKLFLPVRQKDSQRQT
jgi:hypothetical protein